MSLNPADSTPSDKILDTKERYYPNYKWHVSLQTFYELNWYLPVWKLPLTILTALEELEKNRLSHSSQDYLNGFSDVPTHQTGKRSSSYRILFTGHNVDGIKYICEQLDFQQTLKQQLHSYSAVSDNKQRSEIATEKCYLLFYQSSVSRRFSWKLRNRQKKPGNWQERPTLLWETRCRRQLKTASLIVGGSSLCRRFVGRPRCTLVSASILWALRRRRACAGLRQ